MCQFKHHICTWKSQIWAQNFYSVTFLGTNFQLFQWNLWSTPGMFLC